MGSATRVANMRSSRCAPAPADWSGNRVTRRTPKLTRTAVVWLAVAAWCAPAFAQVSVPVLAQSSPNPSEETSPPEEEQSEPERPIAFGVEIELSSGHADRGFVISDRPVVQSVTWVSGSVGELSLWSNLTLAESTDNSRPQILELELMRAHEWGNLTIEPAVRMYLYRDALSVDSSRSIEGWLYVSYDAGPLRLFTNHSVDVQAYPGAYFGEAGIAFDRQVSPRVEIGGAFNAGWASSTLNDAYAGVAKSAFNLVGVEGRLTAYLKPHLYVAPYFQITTIVDRAVRGALTQPTLFLVGLVTGVEF